MWGRGYVEEAAAREQAGAGGSTDRRRRLPSPAVPGSRYCPDRLVLAQTCLCFLICYFFRICPRIYLLPGLEGCGRFQIYEIWGQRSKGGVTALLQRTVCVPKWLGSEAAERRMLQPRSRSLAMVCAISLSPSFR